MKNIDRKKYILPSVLVVLLCMVCFIGRAWAWYTAQATAPVADINAATYGVEVKVLDASNKVVAESSQPASIQSLNFDSNSTYTVKLKASGETSTGYCVVKFSDHVTKEEMCYYTPAIAPNESFEFTYRNGIFESVDGMATIQWENRIKATKDTLTVEAHWGTTEEAPMKDGVVLGREVFKKPASQTVKTNWTIGYNIGSYNHAVGPNSITPGQHYAYTDVITVAKKGTKLTFTDDIKNNSWASNGCYVVSSWKQNATTGEWELDLDGTNIPGKYKADKAITCTENYDVFIERYGTDTSDTDGSITYTYITSKDNETIRFCYYAGKGTTKFPTITMTYSGEMGTAEEIALAEATNTWLEKNKTLVNYQLLEGKKISVIGDSYMAGSSIKDTTDVWVNMLATKYNMTLNNYGVNGSTISDCDGSKHNPMINRWEEAFADDTPDIILVEGGRNDYSYNAPMGELGSTDKGTFKGATTALIQGLKEKFPNALIIGITCWEVGGTANDIGYYCSDYGRAFIEVCESLGVSYINAMDSDAMGVYMTSSNFRGRFCIKAGDISHLNEKGMKRVLPVFEKRIYDFYNAHLNPEQP